MHYLFFSIKGVVDVILCTHSLLGVTKFTSVYLGPFLTLSVRNGSNLPSYLFLNPSRLNKITSYFNIKMAKTLY